jgi:hypothetical protein
VIDKVGEEERLGRKLAYLLPILFIVRWSCLCACKGCRQAAEKKSCNDRQPSSVRQIAICRDSSAQISTPNSHHRLTLVFFLALTRPLHHVTGGSQQTFQPFRTIAATQEPG